MSDVNLNLKKTVIQYYWTYCKKQKIYYNEPTYHHASSALLKVFCSNENHYTLAPQDSLLTSADGIWRDVTNFVSRFMASQILATSALHCSWLSLVQCHWASRQWEKTLTQTPSPPPNDITKPYCAIQSINS